MSASLKLWMVSASSATDPDATMTASCTAEVTQERHEGDLDGADASLGGLERGVDRVGGVVTVGCEDREHHTLQAVRMVMAVVVIVMPVRVMIVVIRMVVGSALVVIHGAHRFA